MVLGILSNAALPGLGIPLSITIGFFLLWRHINYISHSVKGNLKYARGARDAFTVAPIDWGNAIICLVSKEQ